MADADSTSLNRLRQPKLGRRRSPGKRGLPPGLYERNGYWSYRDRLTGIEYGIGRVTRGEAISQALEVQASGRPRFRDYEEVKPLAQLSQEEIIAAARPVSQSVGVYFLVAGGEVKYVGQSINVGRRISEHAQDFSHPFDAWHMIPVPAALLNDTEAAYIAALAPAWNINGKTPASRSGNVCDLNERPQVVDSSRIS